MPNIDTVWHRIVAHECATFTQVRGAQFTYSVSGSSLRPDRTKRILPKSSFEQALRRLPLSGPGAIQDVPGPSYMFAILADPRSRHGDW